MLYWDSTTDPTIPPPYKGKRRRPPVRLWSMIYVGFFHLVPGAAVAFVWTDAHDRVGGWTYGGAGIAAFGAILMLLGWFEPPPPED